MPGKKLYTKKLSTRVAFAAKSANSGKYHVITGRGENWTVVADGNVRATKVFPSRMSAIEFAKESANRSNGEVIIHKSTGEIEERVSLAK